MCCFELVLICRRAPLCFVRFLFVCYILRGFYCVFVAFFCDIRRMEVACGCSFAFAFAIVLIRGSDALLREYGGRWGLKRLEEPTSRKKRRLAQKARAFHVKQRTWNEIRKAKKLE